MAGTDNPNILWDPFENYMLRPLIVQAYSNFKQLPDASYLHDPYSDWLYHQNGYNAGAIASRDASFDRRIARLKENAARYNIPEELIDSHGWVIRMLMQADTPETQEYIKKQLPWFGERLIDAFHAATAYEAGETRLYPSIANTFGTPEGNEGGVYLANHAANLIRQQPINESGLRKFDASSLSTWLRLEQESGFNVEIAAGLNREGVQSYNQVFSNTLNSAEHNKARAIILGSYAQDLAARSSSKTDKQILKQIQKNALAGKTGDALYSGLNSFYGNGKEYADLESIRNNFNIEENVVSYAQASQANIADRIIRKSIQENGELRSAFEAYAAGKNVTLDNPETESHLAAQFVRDVQTGAYTKGIDGSTFATVNQLYQSVESQIGEQYRVGTSVIEQKGYEANLFQGIGQAAWSTISEEERQKYEQLGGDTSGGQTILGKEYADKYAHSSMRYFDYNKAVYDTQRLMATASLAGISPDSMSRQYAFIGSIIKDKSLTGVAAQASAAWQASAKAHGIRLTEEDRMEMGQRMTRMVNSIEGDTYAMFLSQDFDPNSELGKLKESVITGTLSADQEKKLQEYFRSPGKLLDDVAKATGKERSILAEEARYATPIWENMGDAAKENALGAMEKGFRNINNARLASIPNIQMHFRSMSDREKARLGIGKGGVSEDAFQSMYHNIVQDGSVNVTDWAVGNISETDIKKLRERGLNAEADYAQSRVELFKQRIKEYEDAGESTPEAVRKAKEDNGQMFMSKKSAAIMRDNEAAKALGRKEFDMTDKVFRTKDAMGNNVQMNIAEMGDKATTMNINQSGVAKALEDMTPGELALRNKNVAEAEQLADQVINTGKAVLRSPVDMIKDVINRWSGGDKKNKAPEPTASKENTTNGKTGEDYALVSALKSGDLNNVIQILGTAIGKNMTVNVTVQEA